VNSLRLETKQILPLKREDDNLMGRGGEKEGGSAPKTG